MIVIEHEDYFEIGFEDFTLDNEINFSIAPLDEDYRVLIFNDKQMTVSYQFLKELYKKPKIKLLTYEILEDGTIVGYPIVEMEIDKNSIWQVL